MWDPMTWSLSLGRLFGINIRVHVLFPVVALGLVLRVGFDKNAAHHAWVDAAMLVGLLFVIVLLHEFGHCFGARLMDGDATQVLIWPLGGLASVEVPQTARANFWATAAGPLTNLLICVVTGLGFFYLTDFKLRPTWNPLPGSDYGWYPYRVDDSGAILLTRWSGEQVYESALGVVVLARAFWLSWVLFLLNLLPAFPLDGGRMLQCVLWPRWGFRQSMQVAVFAGFVTALLLGIAGIATNEVLVFFLALFVYFCCRQQWILLETGGEDSVFGYDFSQGYTSLEREEPPLGRPRRRQNFWQRWRQNRLARKVQRDNELREAEERRMDELLEKVQRLGLQALSDEERRFLKRVSDKYRNRH